MTEALLQETIRLLEQDPDFYVPVKKLWRTLESRGLTTEADLDYEKFLTTLRADERFELQPSVEASLGGPPPWGPEEEPEMEALGFYLGPRVKLTAREMSLEDVAGLLDRKTQDMMEALEQAWEARPADDPQAEDLLIEALATAQRLRRETLTALDEALDGEPGEKTNPPTEEQR